MFCKHFVLPRQDSFSAPCISSWLCNNGANWDMHCLFFEATILCLSSLIWLTGVTAVYSENRLYKGEMVKKWKHKGTHFTVPNKGMSSIGSHFITQILALEIWFEQPDRSRYLIFAARIKKICIHGASFKDSKYFVFMHWKMMFLKLKNDVQYLNIAILEHCEESHQKNCIELLKIMTKFIK
jgi:hypothetical protein